MAHATSHQLVMVASRAGPLAHLVSHTDNALVDGCSSEEAKQAKGRGGGDGKTSTVSGTHSTAAKRTSVLFERHFVKSR